LGVTFLLAAVAVVATIILSHFSEFRASLLIVLISIVLSAGISSIFLWRVVRRFEIPLRGIHDIATRFAEGNFEVSPYLGLDFRFPEIADALARMGEGLKGKMEILTRQRNEQKAILLGMVEAVIVLNPSLEVVEVNPAAADLMGVRPDQAKGRSLIDLIRNPDLHTFARATLESRETREAEILLSGDRPRYLQIHGSFIHRQAGPHPPLGGDSTDRLVLVLHDITDLKNLERIRKDFVANVSHELKTPITSIKGFIETLKDGAVAEPATAARFLDIIEKQTERMEAIIEDLLSLSRLEQSDGRLPSSAQFELQQVLLSAAELVADSAAKRGVKVVIDDDSPIFASGNQSLIEQAILNLLDNAVKFSRTGGCVHIDAGREEDFIRIAVRDEGIGIPAKELPRIFERFYRVDRARSRELGGTGLGLAIVKHIAIAHGGEVLVESTHGVGSTFIIRIPV